MAPIIRRMTACESRTSPAGFLESAKGGSWHGALVPHSAYSDVGVVIGASGLSLPNHWATSTLFLLFRSYSALIPVGLTTEIQNVALQLLQYVCFGVCDERRS